MILSLILAGVLAGFIDSIAGGGGLITLPAMTLALGPGPVAIGTNKIVGTTGALVALLVYLRRGHFDWRKSLAFTIWVGVGSVLGSSCARFVPLPYFKWFLVVSCPLILWVVWRKDLWVAREAEVVGLAGSRWLHFFETRMLLAGLAAGFYDGLWGPGGGTFMFLGLLFVVKMPLLAALAAAKFSNTVSASSSLVNYSLQGFVHWKEGLLVASGMSVGAFFGARYATKSAAKLVRPVLVVVVALLLVRLLTS